MYTMCSIAHACILCLFLVVGWFCNYYDVMYSIQLPMCMHANNNILSHHTVHQFHGVGLWLTMSCSEESRVN